MFKLLASIIFPIFISIAANSMWLTTEASALSRLNPNYVSFVTYLGPWFFITMAMFESVGTPLTILTARFANREPLKINKITTTVRYLLCWAFLASLLIGSIYLFFAVKTSQHSEVFIFNFWIFSSSMMISIIPWAFRLYFCGLCAGYKKTFVGAISSCSFLFLKLIFSFIFSETLNLDNSIPIGLSTFLAMIGSTVVSYIYYKRIKSSDFSLTTSIFDKTICKTIFFIGLPLMAIHLVSAADSYFFLSMFTKYGERILSNLTILERIRRICLLPIISISIGMSIYISSELSADNKKQILKMISKVCSITAIFYLVSVPFLKAIFPHFIKMITGEDPYFYSIALNILNYEVWVYPILALGLISEGIFEGMGITYSNLVVFVIVITFGRILPITSLFSSNPVYSLQYVYPISHSLHLIGFIWSLYHLVKKYPEISTPEPIVEKLMQAFRLLKIKRREI